MKLRSRRWLLGSLGIVLGVAGIVAGRWAILARNGRRLVAEADRLPREYVVGDGPAVKMVVLGDSTAVGVGAGSLESTLPYRVAQGLGGQVTVTNLSISGARLADVLARQLPRLPSGSDLALVSISANDATAGTPGEGFERELIRLLDGLRGVRRVVLTTTPNFRTTPALPAFLNRRFGDHAKKLTAIAKRVVVRYPSVRLADLYGEGTLAPDEYAADGFHPNAEGYSVWAAILVRAGRE